MRVKLTDRWVAGAAFPRRTDVADSACPGLVLRVTPAGVRTWAVAYRDAATGANKRLTLGRVGEAVQRGGAYVPLTVAVARDLAREVRARLRLGLPAVEAPPQPAAAVLSVAALLGRYIEARAPRLKPSTVARYRNDAKRLGTLADADVAALRRGDVRAWRDAVASERGPAAAEALLAFVNSALAWGVAEELAPRNPAARLEPVHRAAHHRALSDEELVRVWAAGDRFARFLLLTGLRRSEAAHLVWGDLDGAVLTVPPAHRKTRLGADRALVVPLPPLALEVLGTPGPAASRIFGHKRYHARAVEVREASGVTFTWHDLRTTFACGLAAVGTAPHVVARALDHSPATVARAGLAPAVTGVYDRADRREEVAAALVAWTARVAALVEGREAGKVVAFGR